jgi:hypothetical protein
MDESMSLKEGSSPVRGTLDYGWGFSSKKVRALFKRHHHPEFRAEASLTLRMATVVSANKSKGFLKETVKV